MEKVIVIGNGFVAGHLPYEVVNYRFTPNEENINVFINQYKPNVIINCIGRCGTPSVDWCENNKFETYNTNVIIPAMLANECNNRNIHFIHLGSGCINYGHSPNIVRHYNSSDTESFRTVDLGWKEIDCSNPKSYYSKTKYSADLILGDLSNVCILRLRMPVSSKNHPRNLLNKLIKYQKVLEEPNSMTFVDDLVNAIHFVIKNKKTGIYNVASPKPILHSELLEEYKKYFPEHIYEKISVKELDGLVVAPRSNCILDVGKIISEGFSFADTQTRVRETIAKFAENIKKEIV